MLVFNALEKEEVKKLIPDDGSISFIKNAETDIKILNYDFQQLQNMKNQITNLDKIYLNYFQNEKRYYNGLLKTYRTNKFIISDNKLILITDEHKKLAIKIRNILNKYIKELEKTNKGKNN